ncbi:MAG: hypothetical protein LKJ83_03450 [Eubacteriaceae bacterium]|jgi:5-carboxymethyl-2-hydroxymuconate isomerase|nr:hypothetical protein [Eubacteriaceae bacterium]
MPHISLTLYKGRDKDTIMDIGESMQKNLAETLGCKTSDISFSVNSVEADDFNRTVSDILEKDELMIKSDYVK